jgi:hypothetical protein
VISLKTGEGVRKFESIAAGVSDLVLKYSKGALSGRAWRRRVAAFREDVWGAWRSAFRG